MIPTKPRRFLLTAALLGIGGLLHLSAYQFYFENSSDDDFLKQYKKSTIARMNAQEMQQNVQNQIDLQSALSDFNTQVAQDRANFWALYPDKPGFEAAHKKFEDDLFAKDFYHPLRRPSTH